MLCTKSDQRSRYSSPPVPIKMETRGGGSTNNVNHRNPTSGNKPWSELKTVVNDLRRQLTTLSSMIPMNIHFRTLSDGRTRIYFLSTPPSGWETTLLYTDIPAQSDTPTHPQRYVHPAYVALFGGDVNCAKTSSSLLASFAVD